MNKLLNTMKTNFTKTYNNHSNKLVYLNIEIDYTELAIERMERRILTETEKAELNILKIFLKFLESYK